VTVDQGGQFRESTVEVRLGERAVGSRLGHSHGLAQLKKKNQKRKAAAKLEQREMKKTGQGARVTTEMPGERPAVCQESPRLQRDFRSLRN